MPGATSQYQPTQPPTHPWSGGGRDQALPGIESIDPANRVAVVQAGVSREALNEAVRVTPGGERLRLEPKAGNEVLGLELISDDRGVVRTSAAALHDRLGADLPGFLADPAAARGQIHRIWYRLTPSPEAHRSLFAAFKSARDACEAGLDILAAGISPASMMGLDTPALGHVVSAGHSEMPNQSGATLLIDLEGIDVSVDSRLRQVADLCEDRQAVQVEALVDPQRRSEIWSQRSAALEDIEQRTSASHALKASVPRTKLAEVLEHFDLLGQDAGMVLANEFEIGDGTIRSSVVDDHDATNQAKARTDLTQRMLDHVIVQGGVMIDSDDSSDLTSQFLPKMFDQATLETFERIDRVVSPKDATEDRMRASSQPATLGGR